MYEPILHAMLRKLASESETDGPDLWPGIRQRLQARSRKPIDLAVFGPGRHGPRTGFHVPRRVTAAVAASIALAALSLGALQPWHRPTSANAQDILEGIQAEAFYQEAQPSGIVTATAACQTGLQVVGGPGSPSGAFGFSTSSALAPGASGFNVAAPPPGGSLMLQQAPGAGPRPAAPDGADGDVMFYVGQGSPSDGPPGGGVIAIGQGPDGGQAGVRTFGPGPGGTGSLTAPGPGSSAVGNLGNPTELSNRLGQSLGLSGDRVREAMRQTLGTLPTPVDPFSRIATQLGMTADQVRDAFSDASCPGQFTIALRPAASDVTQQAQRLGVSADRLAAAMAAAAPPPPPSFDDTINRLAENLGVTSDRLRAALAQVEGPNRLFLTVPAPGGAPTISPQR